LIYWPLQLSSLETICYQNVGLYNRTFWHSSELIASLPKLTKIVYFVTRKCHQFTTPMHDIKPTKHTNLFLTHLYYNITMNIPTCFGPHDIMIRESNQSSTA
jgi:hypothetical protein